MSRVAWQVQVRRHPDDWEGVNADYAEVESSGALAFYYISGMTRRHIITYGPRAWYSYWRDEMPVPTSAHPGRSES